MRISEAASHDLLKLLSLYANNIKIGDTITARVIAVENGLLMLQLPDGGNINASVQTDKNYNPGDILKLEVTGIKQGQVYVRELEHKQAAQSITFTRDPALILKNLKLPANSDRLEAVKAMLDMEVEPEAGLIEKASWLISEKLVPDARQAVFLSLNDMEGKETYFPLLNEFAEKTFSFEDKWQNLAGKVMQSDDRTLIHLAQEFSIYESIQEKDLSVPASEINYAAGPDSANSRIMTEQVLKNIIFQLLLNTAETDSGIVQNETNNSDVINTAEQFLPGDGHSVTQTAINSIKQFMPGFDSLPEHSRETIVKIIENVFAEIRNETAYPRTKAEAEIVTARFMALLPKKIKEDAKEHYMPEVEKWLDDTGKKIEILKKVFTTADRPDNERVMPALREVETAVRFFQDIQSYEAFVQVPVVLRENTTTGELYIMKRKGKRGKIKPDDFSLFLSLTTKYLGVVDTFIHVRNRNVLIKIMVEDEKYFDILTGQHKPLYEGLKAKGYNLYEIKQVLKDDSVNILNAVKKASEIINDNRRIDYRV